MQLNIKKKEKKGKKGKKGKGKKHFVMTEMTGLSIKLMMMNDKMFCLYIIY